MLRKTIVQRFIIDKPPHGAQLEHVAADWSNFVVRVSKASLMLERD